MAGVSLYDASIVTLIHATTSLRDVLKKGSEHADSSTFPQARLIDDMQPLTFQVKIVLTMAEKAANYLGGLEVEHSEGKEQTMAELIARCESTIKLLGTVDQKTVDGKLNEKLSVNLATNTFEMTGKDFVFGPCLPNVFFHVTTAYAILRMKGVPLGKMDYLSPFMNLPAKE